MNENRKNDIEDVNSAYGSKGSVGVGIGSRSLPLLTAGAAL